MDGCMMDGWTGEWRSEFREPAWSGSSENSLPGSHADGYLPFVASRDLSLVCVHGQRMRGNSLVVQWLGLRASTAGSMRSVPGWGTKILQAMWYDQKKKKKERAVFLFLEEHQFYQIRTQAL